MMASQIVAPEGDWMDRYERFTWMAWEWNVTGAKAILRDHPERVEYASMEQLAARHTRGRTDQVPCFVLSQAESKRLYCGVGGKRSPYWKVQVER
jgi:hypothetical protein